MPNTTPASLSVAEKLPDLPRWVEARAALLAERGEILAYAESPELSFVLLDSEYDTMFVIGEPAAAAIQSAAAGLGPEGDIMAEVAQTPRLTGLLPGWAPERIRVYTAPDASQFPPPDERVRFLDPALLDRLDINEELLEELRDGAEGSPIAAVFAEEEPVAFCYAGEQTERRWDVSIDTLEAHRRQGYAGLCFAHMARHMAAQGKAPVWQALEGNPASWRLALKLGFMEVDEVMIWLRVEAAGQP